MITNGPAMRWGIKIAAMAFVIGFGVFLRIEDFTTWLSHPQATMFRGTPILATFDGYHYLRYARELSEGTYGEIDELRMAPDHPRRPSPRPLISVVAAGISWLAGVRLEWTATFFPSFFSILLFFPLYFMGRHWGNSLSGLIAALVALSSPYYISRNCLGWFDTDCGNVTFTMLAVFLPVLMAEREGRERIFCLVGALLNFCVFFAWWESAQVVAIICIGPLAYSYFFLIGVTKKNMLPVSAGVLLGAGAFTLWAGTAFWTGFAKDALHLWSYISKTEAGVFPSVGLTVSEQASLPLQAIVEVSAGNIYLFVAAVLGLVLLFLRLGRKGVPLFIPLWIGLLTIMAKRFGIFLAPVVGLGTGHLFYVMWEKAKGKAFRTPWTVPLVLGFCLLAVTIRQMALIEIGRTYWPVEEPAVAEGMFQASKETPKGSVIWAWWDHGYPLMYWSGRATITDGAYHGGEMTLINGFPFCSISYRQSANWMSFYVERGLNGFHRVYDKAGGPAEGLDLIRNLMASGPEKSRDILAEKGFHPVEEWLEFLFPPRENRKPLYIMVDQLLVGTSYWWYWLGAWDPETREGMHPVYRSFFDIKTDGKRLTGTPAFVLDLEQGVFTEEKLSFPVSRVVFREKDDWQAVDYREEGFVFEFDPVVGWGVLCTPAIQESVFNKLYFLRMADNRYFKPIRLMPPSFQIWEVRGDAVGEPAPVSAQ